jgi:hypothetical protein
VNFIGSEKEEELMENRKAKQRSGMVLVMIFMVLILMATVSLSSPGVDRATQTLGWLTEKLKGNPMQRTPEEIRERWRVTRPGMILSKDFVPNCEAPGLRALNEKENGQPGFPPFRQAGGFHTNP